MENHQNPPTMDPSPPKEAEERAVEVEKILVYKLEASIKESSTPWSSSFKSCNLLLDSILEDESHPDRFFRARFRRKVHNLIDLLAEHRSVFNKFNVVFAWRLRNIRNGIPSALKAKDDGAGNGTHNKLIERHTERVPSRPSPIVSHGLEVDLMAVENLLLCRDTSPEFNAVGIYGTEGVGKTTLALVIFHSEKVKARFLPRIWISLADRRGAKTLDVEVPDDIFVAKRILQHLGIELETAGDGFLGLLAEARRAIHTELKRKRYLVVLDGVLEEKKPAQMKSVMAMLRDALPRGTGGAVMVTGRVEKMVKEMVEDADGVYRLQPLDEQEKCWHVFKAATGKGEDGGIEDKDERQKVKNEVVKRSHGLPWSSTLLGIIRREIASRSKINKQQQQKQQQQTQ